MKNDSFLQRCLPFVAYFNICFFWGTANIANKLSSSVLHPFLAGSVRFSIASGLMALWIISRRMSFKITRHEAKILITSGCIMYFIHTLLLLFSSRRVEAGISTAMVCLIPISILLVDSLVSRRLNIGWIGMTGIVGGLSGTLIIVSHSLAQGGSDPLGLLLLLASDFIWAAGTIYLKYNVIHPPLQVQIFYQAAVPAVLYLLTTAFTGNLGAFKELTLPSILPMTYMAVADSIIGFTSYVYLIRKWKTSAVSTYAYINPVVGLLMSTLILSEKLTAFKVCGMLIILASVFIIQNEDSLHRLLAKNK